MWTTMLSPGYRAAATRSWLLAAWVVVVVGLAAARGQQVAEPSSSALPSRDVDVVVAESPFTLRTTTDASTPSESSAAGVSPAGEAAGDQQYRPAVADVVKARLGDQVFLGQAKTPRSMILYAGNATTSTSPFADQVFTERGAKAIRFTSKKGGDVDHGFDRVSAFAHSTTTTTPAPAFTPTPSLSPGFATAAPRPPSAGTAVQAAESPSPWSALSGVVSDCLFGFSATCLQRKLLVFVNRISRMERVNLLGSFVSLVRVTEDAPPPLSEHVLEARVADDEDDSSTALEALMEHNVDSFIESHVLRIRLPSWFSSAIGGESVGTGREAEAAVDVNLDDIVETRQKGGSSKKKKGPGSKLIKKKMKQKKKQNKQKSKMMKKMMKGMTKMGGAMMFGMLGKTALLAPLLGLLSTLSLKASAIALLIAKILLLRSVFSGGLGGLGGLGGGGKGGLSSLFSGFGGGGGGTSQPSSNYGAPAAPQSSYGAPAPQSSYGAPAPQSSYGAPAPQSSYGAPAPQSSYSPPSNNYRPPSTGYGTPPAPQQFSPPSTSYGTPTSSYNPPPPSYSPPSSEYGAPTGGSYFPTGSSGSSAGSSSSSSSFGGGGGGGGSGASSGSSAGSSASSFGATAAAPAAQSGYVGGGSHWVNKRAWDANALAYSAYLQEPEMHTTTEPML